jgi:hypothetical protein
VVARWAPNCFVEGFNAQQLVEGAVEGLREVLLGPEAAGAGTPLDLLLLHWPDYVVSDAGVAGRRWWGWGQQMQAGRLAGVAHTHRQPRLLRC